MKTFESKVVQLSCVSYTTGLSLLVALCKDGTVHLGSMTGDGSLHWNKVKNSPTKLVQISAVSWSNAKQGNPDIFFYALDQEGAIYQYSVEASQETWNRIAFSS